LSKEATGEDDEDMEEAVENPKKSAIGQLSEYEKKRLQNIAEHQALLASLGLAGGASKIVGGSGKSKGKGKSSKANVPKTDTQAQDQGSVNKGVDGSQDEER
jgi:hypothetical protein